MTRDQKIVAIYKEMANKELMLGCFYLSNVTRQKEIYDWSIWSNYIGEIIGHPVMIGDVMYYIRKKYWNNHSWFHSDRSKLIDLRSKERESIEWQYDECIDFVHSLIPKS